MNHVAGLRYLVTGCNKSDQSEYYDIPKQPHKLYTEERYGTRKKFSMELSILDNDHVLYPGKLPAQLQGPSIMKEKT